MKGEKYKPHASWVKISRKSPSTGPGIHPDTYFKVKFSASIFLNKGKSDEKYVELYMETFLFMTAKLR